MSRPSLNRARTPFKKNLVPPRESVLPRFGPGRPPPRRIHFSPSRPSRTPLDRIKPRRLTNCGTHCKNDGPLLYSGSFTLAQTLFRNPMLGEVPAFPIIGLFRVEQVEETPFYPSFYLLSGLLAIPPSTPRESSFGSFWILGSPHSTAFFPASFEPPYFTGSLESNTREPF